MPRTVDTPSYLPRIADKLLGEQLHAMGAVLIEGVKGCGKTETARRSAASEVLLDIDREAQLKADLDPRLLLAGDTPRLLDEWQRTPSIWDAVRREVDHRSTPGQFILTGSATPDDEVRRHTGAGRFGVMKMRTMTLAELAVASPSVSIAGLLEGAEINPAQSPLKLDDYLRQIAIGGWPVLASADESAARTFMDGYLDTIVERDINEVAGGPRNPRLVRRFLHAYAQMSSQSAQFSTVIKRAEGDSDSGDGPARQTAKGYFEALERMMIIDDVPAWDPAVRSSKRLMTTPKRQLCDPSMAASLLQMSPERMLDDLETTGFLFESLAAHDIRIYAEAAGAACFHYREAAGRLEVDYVLETRSGDWVGIEVKLGSGQIDKAAESLLRLAAQIDREPKSLAVVTATPLAFTREDGVHVIPLGLLGP